MKIEKEENWGLCKLASEAGTIQDNM